MIVPDLVSILRGIPAADFSPKLVQSMLADVRVEDSSLERYLYWSPKRYTRNLIYRDSAFELIAMCWESGSASQIHNHSGQDCWLYVHQGMLCVDSFDLVDPSNCGVAGDGICVRRRERIPNVGKGTVDHRGPDNDLHRVMNRRVTGQRAISLHVYARPFDDCIIYEPTRRRATRKTMSYDTIEGTVCQPSAVRDSTVAALLTPI
jgi:predicted metal-dependent enzyme (double-stranded beta helix superfamily)